MCDFEKGFILCTCTLPNLYRKRKKKKKRRAPQPEPAKIAYEWILFKFIKHFEATEMGRYILPISNIENGLTKEFVFEQLNSKNCFDFEYTPAEGDNLYLRRRQETHWIYLSFIYKEGTWVDDHYDAFSTEREVHKEGKIQSIENYLKETNTLKN